MPSPTPWLRRLYALAIFLSSCLLFVVEPMAAKRLVPLLGGSASVWTTCLVFFQTALLVGYALAHWLATRFGVRQQAWAYLTVLGAGLLCSLNTSPGLRADVAHPAASVFVLLTATIGVPFVALSASSPLLQAWYARSYASETSLRPPYRLFVLSNLGSLVALACYPALIEPRFTLRAQSVAWCAGLALYTIVCATIVARIGRPAAVGPAEGVGGSDAPPAQARLLLWLGLAACGSMLLCAVTNYLTQNVAAIPLLWVVPLAVYLLSFMLTFQGARYCPRPAVLLLLVGALGAPAYLLSRDESNLDLDVSIPLFCATLLIGCLFCHGELYRLRPAARYSTRFYLCVAAGGALGAFFVGILAPLIFDGYYELSCALLFTALLALIATWPGAVVWRALWMVTTLALVVAAAKYINAYDADSIARLRNFYGALRVTETTDQSGRIRTLYNGTIVHGMQWLAGARRYAPSTYYAHDSGAGLALDLCCAGRTRRVGIIGLGAGTLAAYGRRGDLLRFYDINPLVEPVARRLFTYLGDSQATIEVVPGDARVSLAGETPQNFDVLVIDAFSGDAIPVHLLTTQALALYQRHVRADGIIAYHVSNKYLRLDAVVQQVAANAQLRAVLIDTDDNDSRGEYGAAWVLVTRNVSFLARRELQANAAEIEAVPQLRLWTDDYNSLLPVLSWRSPPD